MLKRTVKRIDLLCLVCLSVVVLFNVSVHGQTKKDDLYGQRDKILKELEYTIKLLNSTTKKKGQSINQVRLINKKITQRKELVNSYQSEIKIIDTKISDRLISIKKLKKDLEKQKSLYADFVKYSYKNHGHFSIAMYLLASENFNQFYLRKKYLEQLKDARLDKIDLISKLQEQIKVEINDLEIQRTNKSKIIVSLQDEKEALSIEKIRKENSIKILSSEESDLKKQLKAKKKIEDEIAKRLESLIKEEASKSKYAAITPEQLLVSADFEKNKGRLPWPTRQGVITERFGEHYHPVIKGVKVKNNGIDISTVEGEQVRCIFEGQVSKVFAIKGANHTVIVKHGTYYTVYHNLYDVSVNVGDILDTKAVVGRVSKSKDDDSAIVHFELWKAHEKLNPELWISK